MNQRERMQKASSGNCAKGGRDPTAQRNNHTQAYDRTTNEFNGRYHKMFAEPVSGESETKFLKALENNRRAKEVSEKQYKELKKLVATGDEDDFNEAVELRVEFIAGTAVSLAERKKKRFLRMMENIRVKIIELAREDLWMEQEEERQRANFAAQQEKQAAAAQYAHSQVVLHSQPEAAAGGAGETRVNVDVLKGATPLLKKEDKVLTAMRKEQKILSALAAYGAKGVQSNKAIPSNFVHKQTPAHDGRASENRHHAGSHYHMASTKAFLKGDKIPGMVARHSRQAAKRNGPAGGGGGGD